MFKRSGTGESAVELVSPLSLETCRSRLAAETDRPWVLFGARPLIGRISGTTLRVRKRIRYRNSFQTMLSARMVEQGRHTRIRCRFSMGLLVKAFLCLWFSFVSFAACGGVVTFVIGPVLLNRSTPVGAWLMLLIPTFMLLFGVGLIRLGRYLARDERQFLVDTLCRTLDAVSAEQLK